MSVNLMGQAQKFSNGPRSESDFSNLQNQKTSGNDFF